MPLPFNDPELNAVENLWQYLRQNNLANGVFDNYDAVVDASYAAWINLIAMPRRLGSITLREWAQVN